MERIRTIVPHILLLVLATATTLKLFNVTHPYGAIRLPVDGHEMVERSRQILEELSVDQNGLIAETELRMDRALLRQSQEALGLEQSNSLIRDSVPAYFWEVRWKDRRLRKVSINSGDDAEGRALGAMRDELHFRFDPAGGLLEFKRSIPDSAPLPSVGPERALAIAHRFLSRYAHLGRFIADTATPQSVKTVEQPKRTDYEFRWDSDLYLLRNRVRAAVEVAGEKVSGLRTDFSVPSQYAKAESESFINVLLIIIYCAAVVAMVVFAFRRFRSFELGFSVGAVVSVVAALAFALELYLAMQAERGWEFLIVLLIVPLFFGGALVIVWAVSESIVREVWKEKFVPIDLLSKGYFFHSRVGIALVRGITFGALGLGLWLLLARAGDSSVGLWFANKDNSALHTFDFSTPWLYVLGHSIYSNIFGFAVFLLFAVSFLKRYISPTWLVLACGSIIFGALEGGRLYPLPVGMPLQILVSSIFVLAFVRYDALAALLAQVTYAVLQEAYGLLASGNAGYANSAYVLLGVLALLVIAGTATLFRKNEITDFESIAPAFARHISERQRLQQELEVARAVQMSFLPKANPTAFRLDIASRCAPALEVGGDYFDFLDLGQKRLGVAVGDVSGKGTQAAFFMTLTKGFLRALAKTSFNPATVLEAVNRLFYENVERGVFISMVYGVFDTQRRTVSLARAGHNPIIMRKSKTESVEVISPKGLALGLDSGNTFSKSIREVKIGFKKGDVFVFYTDGFTEAMNKSQEEFGEDRLCRTVEKYAGGTASEIMEGIFREMKEFVGKAQQHDDLTIVVVKVTE